MPGQRFYFADLLVDATLVLPPKAREKLLTFKGFATKDFEQLTGDFGAPIYSLRYGQASRILLTKINVNKKAYLLVIDILENHEYDKSKFLKNNQALVEHLRSVSQGLENTQKENQGDEAVFENEQNLPHFKQHQAFWDHSQYIILSETQVDAIESQPPALISGPPGSGKTVLAKILNQQENTIYLTNNPYLAQSVAKECPQGCFAYNDFVKQYCGIELKADGMKQFREFERSEKLPKAIEHLSCETLYQEFRLLSVYTCEQLDQNQIIGAKHSKRTAEEIKDIYKFYRKFKQHLANIEPNSDFYEIDVATKQALQVRYAGFSLVIDEAQDLSHLQLKQLMDIFEGRVYFFYGDGQNLKDSIDGKKVWIKDYIYQTFHKKLHECQLKIPQRCPQDIMDLALEFNALRIKTTPKSKQEATVGEPAVITEQPNNIYVKNVDQESLVFDQVSRNANACVVANDQNCTILKEKYPKLKGQIFSHTQIKGLEYSLVVIYDPFLDNVFSELEKHVAQEQTSVNLLRHEKYSVPLSELYVAITRSSEQLVFLLSKASTRYKQLTGMLHKYTQSHRQMLPASISTTKDWQARITALEAQGMQTQAAELRENHLPQVQNPPIKSTRQHTKEPAKAKKKQQPKAGPRKPQAVLVTKVSLLEIALINLKNNKLDDFFKILKDNEVNLDFQLEYNAIKKTYNKVFNKNLTKNPFQTISLREFFKIYESDIYQNIVNYSIRYSLLAIQQGELKSADEIMPLVKSLPLVTEYKDENDLTLLHHAVMNHTIEIATCQLIAKKSNISSEEFNNTLPYETEVAKIIVRNIRKQVIVKTLQDKEFKEKLYRSIKEENIYKFKELVEANPNWVSQEHDLEDLRLIFGIKLETSQNKWRLLEYLAMTNGEFFNSVITEVELPELSYDDFRKSICPYIQHNKYKEEVALKIFNKVSSDAKIRSLKLIMGLSLSPEFFNCKTILYSFVCNGLKSFDSNNAEVAEVYGFLLRALILCQDDENLQFFVQAVNQAGLICKDGFKKNDFLDLLKNNDIFWAKILVLKSHGFSLADNLDKIVSLLLTSEYFSLEAKHYGCKILRQLGIEPSDLRDRIQKSVLEENFAQIEAVPTWGENRPEAKAEQKVFIDGVLLGTLSNALTSIEDLQSSFPNIQNWINQPNENFISAIGLLAYLRRPGDLTLLNLIFSTEWDLVLQNTQEQAQVKDQLENLVRENKFNPNLVSRIEAAQKPVKPMLFANSNKQLGAPQQKPVGSKPKKKKR